MLRQNVRRNRYVQFLPFAAGVLLVLFQTVGGSLQGVWQALLRNGVFAFAYPVFLVEAGRFFAILELVMADRM